MTKHRIVTALSLLVPAAAALWLYASSLDGGRLSDDFLHNYLLDHESREPRVLWGEALADFARPWLGLEGSLLYRPFVSLSYALDLQLGRSAAQFHASNVALHVISTLALAAICLLVVPGARGTKALAACLGGLCFALHPAGVETVAWISGRVSGLETMFHLLALLCFAVALVAGRGDASGASANGKVDPTRDGGLDAGVRARRASPFGAASARTRIAQLLCFGFAACALATKESAAALPLSLLAVDLVDRVLSSARSGEGLSVIVRRQLRFVPLWIAYVLVRWLALGALLGSTMREAAPLPEAYVATFVPKASILYLGGIGLSGLWFWTALVSYEILAIAFVRILRLRGLAAVLLLCAWPALGLVPAATIGVEAPLGGGRLLYGHVPSVALFLALFVALIRQRVPAAANWSAQRFTEDVEPPRPRIRVPIDARVLGGVSILAILVAYGRASLAHLERFDTAWGEVGRIHDELRARSSEASPERPLAILRTPSQSAGVPRLNPNGVFPLLEPPYAATRTPLVSINFVLVRIADSSDLYLDPAPIRAMLDAGSQPLVWLGDRFASIRVDDAKPEFLAPTALADGKGVRVQLASPCSPFAIEALELELVGLPPGASRPSYRWIYANAQAGKSVALELGHARSDGSLRALIDLSHDIELAWHGLGDRLVALELFGVEVAQLAKLEARARLPVLSASRLEGKTVVLRDEETALRAPKLAIALDDDTTLHCVVLGPHQAHRFAVEPDKPVRFPDTLRADASRLTRTYRQKLWWIYYELRSTTHAPGTAARSRLDFFRLVAK